MNKQMCSKSMCFRRERDNMQYYTERNNIRETVNKTYNISIHVYGNIYECCKKYFNNIAWKFPEYCPDKKRVCCGIDIVKFNDHMHLEIPALYRDEFGMINKPKCKKNIFEDEPKEDAYDQYALLDFIEFMFVNIKDIKESWHSYYNHSHLEFLDTKVVKNEFMDEINWIFEKSGILFILTNEGKIERIVENDIVTDKIEDIIANAPEQGVKNLLERALELYRSPDKNSRQDSVEKLWDALERLKTYYTNLDKKSSSNKIVENMSLQNDSFKEVFDKEFKELTYIGNKFRIRHHETNKVEIVDERHFDYFFNRCLSLIATGIQFIED